MWQSICSIVQQNIGISGWALGIILFIVILAFLFWVPMDVATMVHDERFLDNPIKKCYREGCNGKYAKYTNSEQPDGARYDIYKCDTCGSLWSVKTRPARLL